MFRLDGRVALVTGARPGWRRDGALFAEAGAEVVAAWFPGDPYDVARLRRASRPPAAAPRRRRRRLGYGLGRADGRVSVTELGRLDIVVANAGIARDVPFAELDDDRLNSLSRSTSTASSVRSAPLRRICSSKAGGGCWRRVRSRASSRDGPVMALHDGEGGARWARADAGGGTRAEWDHRRWGRTWRDRDAGEPRPRQFSRAGGRPRVREARAGRAQRAPRGHRVHLSLPRSEEAGSSRARCCSSTAAFRCRSTSWMRARTRPHAAADPGVPTTGGGLEGRLPAGMASLRRACADGVGR